MRLKSILSYMLIIATLIFLACGPTQQVEQTGISENETVIDNKLVPAKTSTGLCAMPETAKEKKKVLTAYSLYREDFKQNNYKEALPNWRTVMQLAPGFRKTPYVDGEVMYKAFIELSKSKTQKQLYIDSLYQLYNNRIKCHGEEGIVLQSKAFFIFSILKDKEAAYPILEKAMQKAGDATNHLALKTLFNKYRGDIRDSLKIKEEVIPIVEQMKKIAQNNIDKGNEVQKYQSALDSLNQPLASYIKAAVVKIEKAPEMKTCKEVVEYYGQKYANNPNEIRILKNYYAKLTKMKCYKHNLEHEQIHRQLIADLNNVAPSKATWLQAAIYAAQDGDYPLAIQYYQNAVKLEDDPLKQAKIYNYIAATYRGTKEYQKSAEAAGKAISLNPNLGVAYTSLGWAYLGYFNKCGSTKKDKAAVAYVAADMFIKAKKAATPDPKAQSAFNEAYVHFYSKADLHFDTNINEGDLIKAGCWIQKSSTIRSKTN